MASDPKPSVLPRTLRFTDLLLLKLAAIVNLNLVPSVALHGRTTAALWVLAFALFFVPQAIAVLTLARRHPGEGGVYLWTQTHFGNTHGFVAGWCYWTNNLFYIPMQLVYAAGVAAFARSAAGAADDKWFVSAVAFSWLVLMAVTNVRGLRVGKLVQNVGAIATAAMAVALVVAAFRAPAAAAMEPALGFNTLTTFSVMCLAFVGVELASTMGDEMRRPDRDLRPAVFAVGALSLGAYLAVTFAVLRLVPAGELGAIEGLMQAVQRGAERAGVGWLVAPSALLLSFSLGGSVSAWFAGSARIPFLAGLERALPRQMGAIHPRWGSPHVALLAQAALAGLLLLLTLAGSSISEAYQLFLKTTIVIQLVPFVYMFVVLARLRDAGAPARAAGVVGVATSLLSALAAFIPPSDASNAVLFEVKMVAGCSLTLGIGLLFARRADRDARQEVVTVPSV